MISPEKWQRYIDRQSGDGERKEVASWLQSLSPSELEEVLETGWRPGAPPMPEDAAERVYAGVLRTVVRRPVWRMVRWVAAASVLLALALPLIRKIPAAPVVAYANPSDTVSALTLADGSRVWLSPHSTLRVRAREVRLEGEAYFEVQSNPALPFRVITTNMTTRVLGTHFKVYAYPGEPRASVDLSEGRVEVAVARGTRGGAGGPVADSAVYLSPGHRLIYRPTSGLLEIKPFSLTDETAWKNGALVLDSLPVEDALRKVAARFNKKLLMDEVSARGRLITGIYEHPDLQQVLNNIAFVQRLHFSVQGDTIRVQKP